MTINVRKTTTALGILVLTSAFLWGQFHQWLSGDVANPKPSLQAQLTISHIEQIGSRSGRGNLLGIQPWMEPIDYRTALTFREKIERYLQTAQDSGLIVPRKTIVVLPEYLGTWLVAMNEANRVYTAKTIREGLTAMVLSHPGYFWDAYRNTPNSVGDKTRYAAFSMKARQMAYEYQLAFDMLAAKFEVTIVAGSILLPNPSVEHGKLTVKPGPLYNVTAVFHPDGQLDRQLVKKVFPIADERPFVCPSPLTEVPVFDTPAGRLGVLICADSWHSSAYKALKEKKATLLAVPSYSAGDGIWKTTWKGYSGTTTPSDAQSDIGHLTEEQAWLAHAMASRATPEAGIAQGINVFLRGTLWDLGSDGTTLVLNHSSVVKTQQVNEATITCLWL